MFPTPVGPINAAAEAYGDVKQKQEERLHEQEHPKQAQKEENAAQGKQQFDDPQQESEDLKEIKKATASSLTHA